MLVRYNPEGDRALNLRRRSPEMFIQEFRHTETRSLFMLEPLVPAREGAARRARWSKEKYDLELRPRLMVQDNHELQDSGVEPDVWSSRGSTAVRELRREVAARPSWRQG